MTAKRTTIYLDERDRQALATLQACYGMATQSDVIRFALRALATLAERAVLPQEVSYQGLLANGEQPRRHVPLTPTIPPPTGSVSVLAPVSADEDVVILHEKLEGTQEELAVLQEELARTQEELNLTTRELQALNQKMLEMSAQRDGDSSPRTLWVSMDEPLAEQKATTPLNKHRITQLLTDNISHCAENRRLVCQAREEVTRLQKTRMLEQSGERTKRNSPQGAEPV
jgi:hypothetical protein